MKARYISRCLALIRTGCDDAWADTVPILVDNQAAVIMNESDNLTRRARHIESRYWYGRYAVKNGHAKFVKVEGKTQQPADLGTKNIQEADARPYLLLFEAPYYT